MRSHRLLTGSLEEPQAADGSLEMPWAADGSLEMPWAADGSLGHSQVESKISNFATF